MLKRVLLVLILGSLCGAAFAGDFDAAESLATRGFFVTLFLVFGAGVLVSLTPCVYPMIPITLSIIGARSAEQKPLQGFLRSLVFVLGIALVYSAIGLIAASLGKPFQFLLQSKWFWLFLSVFFVAMGMSMLGFFELQLPPSIASKLQGTTSGKGGFLGAFLVGLVTGVAASPCGSPVLTGLVTLAGKSGRPVLGVLLMFSYALGMGLLFLVLGTFPAFLKAIPKSGSWMEDIRRLLGVVLIGAALWYFQYVVSGFLYWLVVVLACLAGAAVITIKSGTRKNQPALFNAWRATGAALALFALYAAFVQIPRTLVVPPVRNQKMASVSTSELIAEAKDALANPSKFTALEKGDASAAAVSATTNTGKEDTVTKEGADGWLNDEAEALALAKKQKKPLIIDFGAEWCEKCKELEKYTFSDPKVIAALSRFVKLRIDCTELSDKTDALQKKYGVHSLPKVGFLDKAGNELPKLSLETFEKPDKFLERVGKVPE